MANKKYVTPKQFKQPGWPKTTTTPIEPKESQKVERDLMSTLMHKQLVSNIKYHGSRADLRKIVNPDG